MSTPLERLRYHVTGAIERGEAEPVVSIPAPCQHEFDKRVYYGERCLHCHEWKQFTQNPKPSTVKVSQ
jgi:hypothetical protein